MSAPVPTLRIDTSGTAFGTAPTYTDRTSYLMTGSQYPVDITFGRQDEQSEPQPSTCSFFLSNANGFWTPGAGVGPAGWDIGCPVNVRLTANAVTYDRFTGFVDAIEPTWPGGVQSWSVVKVSCTDVAARLGAAGTLRSLQQIGMTTDATGSASYVFPMQDTSGSTTSADLENNLQAYAYNGAAFGVDMPGFVESTSGVSLVGGATNVGTYVALSTPAPNVGAASWEWWFLADVEAAPATARYVYAATYDEGSITSELSFSLNATTGFARAYALGSGASATVTGAVNLADGLLHCAIITLASDLRTLSLYVDGVLIGSSVAASAMTVRHNREYVGSDFALPTGQTKWFLGTISHVARYAVALTATQALNHYQAGVGTGPTERSDQRFTRIAAVGGITTSGLPTGVATMGGQRTLGVTAIEALKKTARTEGTFAYVTTAGALTFQARTHRYHRAVELALPSPDIATPGVRRDRQGVANELTVTREGGASQVVIDSASQTAIGRFDGGSFEVCPSTDEDGWQNATWQVQNRKTTRTRMPDLTVDLYRQTSTTVVAQCLGATIGTKAQVTSLPANAPASSMTLFAEGYTETIGYDRWSMGFYTSPVGLEDSVLVLDNATTGVLDTYRLGF